MASAIGSLPSAGVVPTPGSSTAGTEAQIARYKKELADCINCESANTTEGKAVAAASQVSIAGVRIESMSASSQKSSTDTSTTTNDSSAKAYAGALTYERPVATESGSASKLSDAPAGTNVDIFA